MAHPRRFFAALLALGAIVAPLPKASSQEPATPDAESSVSTPSKPAKSSVLDLTLDQLSKTDVVVPSLSTAVTSVSREPSTVGRSAAAVFVITPEMIQRSGATSVPETLRMVPGLNVAKIDSNTWAISSRGFNGQYSGTLLVQIDQRIVYDPLFNGVFWDVQDLPLQNIERIEVVRGPGATVWGSNAVNGVISITTKIAKDTQGVMISGLGGNQERGTSTAQYGGKVGTDLNYRIYGRQFERGPGFDPVTDQLGPDSWRQQRGGFRADWNASDQDIVTMQGDMYNGTSGHGAGVATPAAPFSTIVDVNTPVSGGNTMLRWNRTLSDDSSWQIQTYYDRTVRGQVASLIGYKRSTYDIDGQYAFHTGENHHWVTGWGYRSSCADTFGTPTLQIIPPDKLLEWTNCFVQDTITLVEDVVYFTAGTKFEYQTYSNLQVQPTLRLLYLPSKTSSSWIAVSRAARSPSQSDTSLSSQYVVSSAPPTSLALSGNPNIGTEDVVAFELGYRAQQTPTFSWDVATFYNVYHNISGFGPLSPQFVPPNLILQSMLQNNLHGNSYGAELATTWQVDEKWRLYGAYTLLFVNVTGFQDVVNTAHTDSFSAPTNQLYLQSSWTLSNKVQCDLIGRFNGAVVAYGVPSYAALDARISWRPRPHLEFALVGQNLSEGNHFEYGNLGATQVTQVPRTAYGMMTYSY